MGSSNCLVSKQSTHSNVAYCTRRKTFGGMGWSQLAELKARAKENGRFKKVVVDPEFDKLILKESRDFLKLKA